MIFNGKKVDVLAEEFKQRAFDGKWERIVKIMDLDNTYTFIGENGSRMSHIPMKWVTVEIGRAHV